MSAQHTPGKWKVLPEEGELSPYLRVRGTRPSGRFKIANVLCMFPQEAEESRANARLIAAAPELLAALQTVANADGSPLRFYELMEVHAAIAKATGKKA